MYQRKDGLWCDTLPREGKSPKFFYGKTKAEVKRKMKEFSDSQERGDLLSAAIDEWLAYKQDKVSYNTYEGYRVSIRKINAKFKNVHVSELTTAQIHSFLQGLADSGLGKTSVERCYDVLNGLYKYLINKDGSTLTYNPCVAVEMPSGLISEPRELASKADIDIIKANLNHPFGLFPYLLIYTGLRKGEALALTDKSFQGDVIVVENQVVWQPNKPIISKLKTKNSKRKVPILDPLKKALPKKWNGYLFSLDGGKTPLGRKEFDKLWNYYRREVGLADKTVLTYKGKKNQTVHKTEWTFRVTAHQLRHEFATICLDADISAKDASDLLGHSTPVITEKTYQHIRDSRRQLSADKLNKFVNSNY